MEHRLKGARCPDPRRGSGRIPEVGVEGLGCLRVGQAPWDLYPRVGQEGAGWPLGREHELSLCQHSPPPRACWQPH